MILFFAVLVALIGYPVYIYLDSAVHGGIKDLDNGYKEVDLKAMSVFPFDQENGPLNDIPQKWRDGRAEGGLLRRDVGLPYAGRYVDSFELCYFIANAASTARRRCSILCTRRLRTRRWNIVPGW